MEYNKTTNSKLMLYKEVVVVKKYVCTICGYIYDEDVEKIAFETLPDDWTCPLCGAPKALFEEVKEEKPESNVVKENGYTVLHNDDDPQRELTAGEISAICSNLAKGCEKQYLQEESVLFTKLADYYDGKKAVSENSDFSILLSKIKSNLDNQMAEADYEAEKASDRGAKRALLWSRKVSTILKSLVEKYEKEGDSMIEGTNVYVCEICGFVYIGDNPPDICPVCKVPKIKFTQIRRNA